MTQFQLYFWKLSLGNLYHLVKAMFARDGSKRAGSEARGEGRERGYLSRTTSKPPASPEGWWDNDRLLR